MKKKILSLGLVLSLALGLNGCGAGGRPISPSASASAPASPSATVVFQDDCGRAVEVPREVQAIVPSGPLAQIILYAIAPEKIVGLASRYGDTAAGIIPAAHQDLPYFGQLYNSADLNVEELAAVGPQLILDIGESKGAAAEDLNDLQATTQIPTVFLSTSLETIPQTFRRLGELLDKAEKGEQLAQFCEKVYSRTLSVLDKVGDAKVNALYILGEQGLNVLARDSYHAELLDLLTNNLAVVENPSGKGMGNEVTLEQIALWNPDFILFAPDSLYDTAAQMDTWQEITAVKNRNYVQVPEGPHNWMGTPPAVQRYLGMLWLTAELYPEYCDYDVKAEVLEYYELFYSCALTDDQYNALTQKAFRTK